MRCTAHHARRGNISVLAAFMLMAFVAVLGLTVDLGFLCTVRTELQRSADAAALAAAWEFLDRERLTGITQIDSDMATNATATARRFAGLNQVIGTSPALGQTDVLVGYMPNPFDRQKSIDESSPLPPNTVQVTVRRSSTQNGEVPLFFARIFGDRYAAAEAEATAALLTRVRGFEQPKNGTPVGMIPIACDLESWNQLIGGNGPDDWRWDEDTHQLVRGSDYIRELNVYPQGTGSPGNRGTVDIGSDNNSTADIARQIAYGLSQADLDHHGGRLELDVYGELQLKADPGISAGIKDELADKIGVPVIMPVFSQISGNGNAAQYTIVKFVGVRILDVKLTGKMKSKRVIIQPANVLTDGVIPETDELADPSDFVYSRVFLVR